MNPRKTFLLRISPALYQSLEAWAQQEMRSVNGQIEYLLREALRKRGRPVDDAAETSTESEKTEH
jgi:hypothetical protein